VRRYVVERPVEQDITLRGERVTIERRRPIDTTGAPGRAFEERVVEVHETEEAPVVAKTVRVVEDVAIRKEETERTETVRDTVRREDVEVTEPDQQGQPASKP
jgi:stress response protein YsnF